MKKTYLVILILGMILIGSGFWFVANHFWFPFDRKNIFLNSMSAPIDYLPVKSLMGDIYLRHQDNGKEYVICVRKQEVNVVKDSGGFIDLGIVYTSEPLANSDDPQVKIKITDSNLIITEDTIEFTDRENYQNWVIKR